MPDLHPIQHLAQKCARANLPLRQSTQLFEALYLADATAIEGGNLTHAATRAGIARTSFLRLIATRHPNTIGTDQ